MLLLTSRGAWRMLSIRSRFIFESPCLRFFLISGAISLSQVHVALNVLVLSVVDRISSENEIAHMMSD